MEGRVRSDPRDDHPFVCKGGGGGGCGGSWGKFTVLNGNRERRKKNGSKPFNRRGEKGYGGTVPSLKKKGEGRSWNSGPVKNNFHALGGVQPLRRKGGKKGKKIPINRRTPREKMRMKKKPSARS